MSVPSFCNRCLYSTHHPLGLVIDDEGVCSGCRIHEEKDTLDWDERWSALERIVQPYRSREKPVYDCIVPVTGGNDSYFILHIVKERLGLNPLLVTYNKYFNTQLGIRNLANLRIRFDCDIVIQNVNMNVVREATRAAMREIGSIYWPCLAGQTVFPVQTAVRYGVPLIIWGAHQGLEQVGMFSHEHEVEMTRRYRTDHDLLGTEEARLASLFGTLRESDLAQYRYPDDADLDAVGVRGIYLGNYVRWDPKAQHEQMIATHGYRSAPFARTFDTYDHVDCHNFMNLHDLIKLYKHGYSKVTDHASREIRHGRLTREQGLALVRAYEQVPPEHDDKFCEWLGVERNGLQFILDQYRNPEFWTATGPKQWAFAGLSTRIDTPTEGIDVAAAKASLAFEANDSFSRGKDDRYVIIGRGYP